MPPTGEEHTTLGLGIGARLWFHARRDALGLVTTANGGYVIARDPDTVLVPDAAFIRAERLAPDWDRSKFVPLPPDLAVEVISPSDTYQAVADKITLYLDAGTRIVWIVNPRNHVVTVHVPDKPPRELRVGDVLDGGGVLPGFELPLADIFS